MKVKELSRALWRQTVIKSLWHLTHF